MFGYEIHVVPRLYQPRPRTEDAPVALGVAKSSLEALDHRKDGKTAGGRPFGRGAESGGRDVSSNIVTMKDLEKASEILSGALRNPIRLKGLECS